MVYNWKLFHDCSQKNTFLSHGLDLSVWVTLKYTHFPFQPLWYFDRPKPKQWTERAIKACEPKMSLHFGLEDMLKITWVFSHENIHAYILAYCVVHAALLKWTLFLVFQLCFWLGSCQIALYKTQLLSYMGTQGDVLVCMAGDQQCVRSCRMCVSWVESRD